MLIILDGPEKAGKTTIANVLKQKYGATVRHWGPVQPDDRVYAPVLQGDTLFDPEHLYVWDRCWPAEYVYARLLGRPRRLASDPWLGEWLHGRAVATAGVRAIILGPSADHLRNLRTFDDLPVHVEAERQLYERYARSFAWQPIENPHEPEAAEWIADALFDDARTTSALMERFHVVDPHIVCGPLLAPILVVGNARNPSGGGIPGSWLPFTSRMTTEFGRLFGDWAMRVMWGNQADCPIALARAPHVKLIIACGDRAVRWATHVVAGPPVVALPHPSYLYRFKREGKEVENARHQVQAALRLVQPHGMSD